MSFVCFLYFSKNKMSVFDELYKEDIEALGQIDNGAEITGRTDDDVVSCLHALSFVHICTHVN